MIVDSETLTQGATVVAGICVVGSGAAGTTVALGLVERGIPVVLLESGGFEVDPFTEDLNAGEMTGLRTWSLESHRRRVLGGSTVRWEGWCMPMQTYDFSVRSYVPNSGWPISEADLAPFAAAAHRRVDLADPNWDVATVAAAAGVERLSLPGGRAEVRHFQFSPPTRFGTKYREALEASGDATVYLHATVVEIVLDAGRERIERLRCRTPGGVEFEVQVDICVLALGGIENARILLASNAQLDAGVANSSDCVGRYFMEHPHLKTAIRLRAQERANLDFFSGRREASLPFEGEPGTARLLGVLGLSAATLESEGLLDATASFQNQESEPELTGVIEGSDVGGLFGAFEAGKDYRLVLRAEQSPHRDSRITLLPETDAFGVPRASLDWRIAEEDFTKYTRLAEIIGSELALAGVGRAWIPRENGLLSNRPDPGGHHMGTTRMSDDPEDGVVDSNCRAHDVENLYIAGSSVFRTGSAANPTLTIVKLAERLAAHLAEEVS